jgi:hypothetical protein
LEKELFTLFSQRHRLTAAIDQSMTMDFSIFAMVLTSFLVLQWPIHYYPGQLRPGQRILPLRRVLPHGQDYSFVQPLNCRTIGSFCRPPRQVLTKSEQLQPQMINLYYNDQT